MARPGPSGVGVHPPLSPTRPAQGLPARAPLWLAEPGGGGPLAHHPRAAGLASPRAKTSRSPAPALPALRQRQLGVLGQTAASSSQPNAPMTAPQQHLLPVRCPRRKTRRTSAQSCRRPGAKGLVLLAVSRPGPIPERARRRESWLNLADVIRIRIGFYKVNALYNVLRPESN